MTQLLKPNPASAACQTNAAQQQCFTSMQVGRRLAEGERPSAELDKR